MISLRDEQCNKVCRILDDVLANRPTERDALIVAVKTAMKHLASMTWIPFKTRPLTEEEKEEYPEWDCILDCKLPDDGQRILVTIRIRGHEEVQQDEFYSDEGVYADGHNIHAYRCSECGGHILEYDADPFCRWCGADMRGEQE